ncbi:hypothetical protein JW835_16525 [bacterium]|nr:hypothetical protein [bacterium]
MNDKKSPPIDSHGNEDYVYLFFLPWLNLQKALRVNQVTLVPFPSKDSDAELKGQNSWVSQRLKHILHSYQKVNEKPAAGLTYIRGPGGPCISVNDRHIQSLFGALDLTLNILEFRYLNYDSFQYEHDRLHMHCATIYPSSEEIFSLSRQWFHESWAPLSEAVFKKYNSITLPDIRFPLRRIKEVFRALQNSSDHLRERISLVIRILKLANLESTQATPQICLELVGAAFEHLFEHPNIIHPESFAFKLEDLWNYPFRQFEYHPSPFKNKQLKTATQMKTFRLARPPSSKKSWLQAWFLEFFKLRNDLLFVNPINPKEYAWNLTQHLRVATEILAMTIIIILSRDDQTRLPLKNEDERRIRSVDAYIQYARSIWYAANYPSVKQPDWLQGGVLPNLWDSMTEEKE